MFHKLKTLAAVTVALGLSFSAVSAEDWAPTKPIKIQVGFGAGGSTDTLSRVLASEIEKKHRLGCCRGKPSWWWWRCHALWPDARQA